MKITLRQIGWIILFAVLNFLNVWAFKQPEDLAAIRALAIVLILILVNDEKESRS